MAYNTLYRFNFLSCNGRTVDILIKQDGYSGEILQRNVSGTPTLRLDNGGAVCGSSLEFLAECLTADEYATLYTSDPYKYRVEVTSGSAMLWQGYITPELYAAPWVDAPYDVTVTATDGLGELKSHPFTEMGRQPLSSILSVILGYTGLSLPVRWVNTLTPNGMTAATMPAQLYVNLDHLAGETCYTVLQDILQTLHATIRMHRDRWLIVRETDVNNRYSSASAGVQDTDSNVYALIDFGSMQTFGAWPVGSLRMEVEPGKNEVKVSAANHYSDQLLRDADCSLGSFGGNALFVSSDGGYYSVDPDTGRHLLQTYTFAESTPATDMRLTISARAATGGAVITRHNTTTPTGSRTSTGASSSTAGRNVTMTGDGGSGSNLKVTVSVLAVGSGGSTARTYYLTNDTTYGWNWTSLEPASYSVTLAAAKYYDHRDCRDIELEIPLYQRGSGRVSWRFTSITSITIKIEGEAETSYIHGCHMEAVSPYTGFDTKVVLDNNARGSADTVELHLADTCSANAGFAYMDNIGRAGSATGTLATSWSGASLPALPFGEAMAKDYALSLALPRMRVQGKLNVDTDWLPLFLRTDGIMYIAESWAFDLLNDEADISMLSLPAAALSTTSVTVTATNDATASSSSTAAIAAPTSFSVSATDTDTRYYISVTAPASRSWTVTGKPSWMTLSATYGSGSQVIYFTVAANSGSARSATLTVGDTSVSVSQASGVSQLSVLPSSLTFGAAGNWSQLVVSELSYRSWTLSATASWLTLSASSDGSGGASTFSGTGSATVYAIAAQNTSTEARSASILVKDEGGNTVQTIPVAQAAASSSRTLEDIDINGPLDVYNRDNVAQYTVTYIPANTPASEKGVTWSIVSGSQYASINSSTGLLTVKSGANGSPVKILCTSTFDPELSLDWDITVTHFGEVPVTAIGIVDDSGGNFEISINDADMPFTYSATLTPSDTTQTGVDWSVEEGEDLLAETPYVENGILTIKLSHLAQPGDKFLLFVWSLSNNNVNAYQWVTVTA